jgi:hypothetical protein
VRWQQKDGEVENCREPTIQNRKFGQLKVPQHMQM